MRRKTLDSCWFQYALLILLVAGGTTGGLILLGCFDWEMTDGSQVVDRQHHYDGQGGVKFGSFDPDTKADVTLSPTVQGEKVTWYKPKYQPYLEIPDPNNSNQIRILRPPSDVRESTVTVEGDYTKDGTNHHVSRYIHVTNEPILY